VSSPIRETLTSRILHGKRRTVAIVVTKYDPVIVAEIVLCQIPMQMFLLINAFHAPLEDREITFNGVSRHITARIFFGAVVDRFVL
jgi:hypothetical protein